MVSKEALELAPLPSPGFYSNLFLVPKKSDGQPKASKSLYKEGEVQDGDYQVYPECIVSSRLGEIHRPELLPHSSTSWFLEAPQDSGRGQGVPVQGSAFQTVTSPKGVLLGHRNPGHPIPQTHHLSSSVLGRLVPQSHIKSHLSAFLAGRGHSNGHRSCPQLCCQFHELLWGEICLYLLHPTCWPLNRYVGGIARLMSSTLYKVVDLTNSSMLLRNLLTWTSDTATVSRSQWNCVTAQWQTLPWYKAFT